MECKNCPRLFISIVQDPLEKGINYPLVCYNRDRRFAVDLESYHHNVSSVKLDKEQFIRLQFKDRDGQKFETNCYKVLKIDGIKTPHRCPINAKMN